MVYRLLRIPVCLVAAVLIATIVNGSSPGPAVRPDDIQPRFRIVTPNVSDVITQDVTPEIARTLGMNQAEGVVISDVYCPLHRGDVILSVNGRPVGCQTELNALLADVSYGQALVLTIYRDGRIQTVAVQRAVEPPPPPTVSQGTTEIRGMRVASLSTQDGVIIVDTQIGTTASDVGLKRGDVILDVDGHPVHSAGEFFDFISQLGDRHATFNVMHTNGHIDVFTISE
jgi:serine protease Do